MRSPIIGFACVLLGCGADVITGGDATTGDVETGTSTSTSTSTSTGSTSSSGSVDSGSDESSTSSGSSGTETGDEPPPGQSAILLRKGDATGGVSVLRALVDDDGIDGPVLAHDPDGGWWSAFQLPNHRVVYLVQAPASALRLATLDDPLPAATEPLDVPPAPSGFDGYPSTIPDADALLYSRNDSLWRVDFDGLSPAPPELVASYDALEGYFLDPRGRYALVYSIAPLGNIALDRVALDPAAPDDVEPLGVPAGNTTPFGYATTATGDGAFIVAIENGDTTLLYTDLSEAGVPAPVTIVGPLEPPVALYSPNDFYGVRPHPDAPGVVFGIGESDETVDALYVGIDDGVPLPAVPLHTSSGGSHLLGAWTPDGRWLASYVYTSDGAAEFGIVHFGDGHTPTTTPIRTLEPNESWYLMLAPDSTAIYFQHQFPGSAMQEILRVRLIDDVPGEVEVVVPALDYQFIAALAPDGELLLFTRREREQEVLYAVDVSGDVPGDPFQVSPTPPPGYHALQAEVSPDGRYVAYLERANFLPDSNLRIVSIAAPGRATTVSEDVVDFAFVRDW